MLLSGQRQLSNKKSHHTWVHGIVENLTIKAVRIDADWRQFQDATRSEKGQMCGVWYQLEFDAAAKLITDHLGIACCRYFVILLALP